MHFFGVSARDMRYFVQVSDRPDQSNTVWIDIAPAEKTLELLVPGNLTLPLVQKLLVEAMGRESLPIARASVTLYLAEIINNTNQHDYNYQPQLNTRVTLTWNDQEMRVVLEDQAQQFFSLKDILQKSLTENPPSDDPEALARELFGHLNADETAAPVGGKKARGNLGTPLLKRAYRERLFSLEEETHTPGQGTRRVLVFKNPSPPAVPVAAGLEEPESVVLSKLQHHANLTFDWISAQLAQALQEAEARRSWAPFIEMTRAVAELSDRPDFTLNLERELSKTAPELLSDVSVRRWAQDYFMFFQEQLQLLANFAFPDERNPGGSASLTAQMETAQWYLKNVFPVEHWRLLEASGSFPRSYLPLREEERERLRELHRSRWEFFAPLGEFPVPSSLLTEHGVFLASSILSLAIALKEAGVGPGSHLLDLGSGVGDPVLLAAHVLGAHATGTEQASYLAEVSSLWVDEFSRGKPGLRRRIMLRQGDFFLESDLRPYTHLYHFGFHGGTAKDREFWDRFQKELLPRAVVGTKLILQLPFPDREEELPLLFNSPNWKLQKNMADLYFFERVSAGLEEMAGAINTLRQVPMAVPGSIGDAALVFMPGTYDLATVAVQMGAAVAVPDDGPEATGLEELLRALRVPADRYAVGVLPASRFLEKYPRQVLIEDRPKGFRVLGLRWDDLPPPVAAGLEAVLAYLDTAVEA